KFLDSSGSKTDNSPPLWALHKKWMMSGSPAVAAVYDRRQYSNLRDRRRSFLEAARYRACASRTAATVAILDFLCKAVRRGVSSLPPSHKVRRVALRKMFGILGRETDLLKPLDPIFMHRIVQLANGADACRQSVGPQAARSQHNQRLFHERIHASHFSQRRSPLPRRSGEFLLEIRI